MTVNEIPEPSAELLARSPRSITSAELMTDEAWQEERRQYVNEIAAKYGWTPIVD